MRSFSTDIIVGKFSEFKLPLKSLPVGTHEFKYHLDKRFFVNMESSDIHDASVDVALTATYKSDIYDLAFAVSGNITLLCDRCLDDLQFQVDTDYHITVKYGDEYCDDSDELLVIPESDNYLNVAYMIYDTVSLAIPIKHVHPQGQCNKAMSAMLKKHRAYDVEDLDDTEDLPEDAEVTTDPRWDELKKLTENN